MCTYIQYLSECTFHHCHNLRIAGQPSVRTQCQLASPKALMTPVSPPSSAWDIFSQSHCVLVWATELNWLPQ